MSPNPEMEIIVSETGEEVTTLSRWRLNSPFIQTLILDAAVFCGPGMNTTILGLGAGGSRPSEIPNIDKINIVNGVLLAATAFFGGSINNKLGPRWTLLIGASGYPLYVGSLWWIDSGRAFWFPYAVSVYHGIAAGLFYSAAGYIATSYAPENLRGKYVGSLYVALAAGSAVGSGIVLGISAGDGSKRSHVPQAVYISMIAFQSTAVFLAIFIVAPAKVRRNDGRKIAHFVSTGLLEELAALRKALTAPGILLTSLALFSSQMPFSLISSLNAFYFDARTRALANFCFWICSAIGGLIFGLLIDSKLLGLRRRCAIWGSALGVGLTLIPFIGLVVYLSTHHIDRSKAPPGIDWANGSSFVKLLVIYIFLGLQFSYVQAYLLWVCSTFTNEPTILSRYSGYIEGMKATGLIVAFAIDSNHVAFMTETATYFSLLIPGLMLCFISAILYTKNTRYGEEDLVVIPKAFERDHALFVDHQRTSIKGEASSPQACL